jgi:hypothetical protein
MVLGIRPWRASPPGDCESAAFRRHETQADSVSPVTPEIQKCPPSSLAGSSDNFVAGTQPVFPSQSSAGPTPSIHSPHSSGPAAPGRGPWSWSLAVLRCLLRLQCHFFSKLLELGNAARIVSSDARKYYAHSPSRVCRNIGSVRCLSFGRSPTPMAINECFV